MYIVKYKLERTAFVVPLDLTGIREGGDLFPVRKSHYKPRLVSKLINLEYRLLGVGVLDFCRVVEIQI